jgi:hypothetical protein
MSKTQAEEIARKYVESNKKHFGNVSQEAIENAVKRVAGALTGLPLQVRA